ncbi:1-phosphofructokinase family hexose kinase [Curtobacterium flaccumfaciens]|uniref:1-phosphofructokinase family hexose kinase n=1 Tax=Curtobacterium flaccumfaciens TaxID=2035 RepID=UPI001BDEB976|nr:PfkB family carbohydrate kinase [Curtobacterium flaccumfaciens]MBT1605496.1 1-phosphofructokinase [Curtobacterium flaccumfaciens pv. betae]MBT1656275.1 1-phosphofructokinase [Curtobacterium flaccumfaciens pv. betae]MCS0471028.1 PfkB family carbohydrate kinase [Curtobacterium flaccumfaciens pv. betae]MCS0475276.1 PfkB family carbohydrate kinase [Curtobacterium flaccumfaciens pv. betae]MCS0477440.1 PfkB family carbohydrate kinase [Curtobacterium flaccumfaciens pv. betae]
MILVVTPNPAVDVTYRVAEQRIGETQRVLEVQRRPGGKGLNVGRVLAATGVPTHAVLPLGGDGGRWITHALDDLGLVHTDVAVRGETRTTVTVVDDLAHPTMFGEPGPVLSPDEWDTVTAAVETLLDSDVGRTGGAGGAAGTPPAAALVVSGSLPRDSDPAVVARWVTAARHRGVLSVVDCSGTALLAAASAGATVCKPNREELLEATGTDDERSGALRLLGLGATVVVVSRGSDGIAAHTTEHVLEVPAVPGVSGNPTGAGDAATAGLVGVLVEVLVGAGLPSSDGSVRALDDATLLRALRSAAAHGAAAVLQPVAGAVDAADVHRFLSTPPDPAHDRTRTPA